MEVADDDTLDAYFNVSSEILPTEEIRRYSIVDEIDTRKARALGVSEERLTNLTSRFGVERFPQVALNVPDVTLSTKKTRILQEIDNMPIERGDTQDISRPQKRAKPSFSRLKPMELSGSFQPMEDGTRPASPTRDNSPGPSQRKSHPPHI
ncbi:hypothetical protein R1flu_010010 [Riccia fluitans]|uniref:Uncharacterized protein n=1 Tax=Riccia fluitans TaxID=41844 RepID=A0ABD1Z4M4_9MARC